jgi:hypothetical protein
MHVHFVGELDDSISVSSHHARALAAVGVNVSFEDETTSETTRPRPDIIHLVTFEQLSNGLLRHLVAARVAGTQIARYWTGRDAVWAADHRPSHEFAQAIGQMGAAQFCRSQELSDQLSILGVRAKVLPVISSNMSGTAPPQTLPSLFTALSYLPRGRREFHGGTIIDALAERLPSVRFLILGGGGVSLANRPNVEWLGDFSDGLRAVLRSTVLIDARRDGSLSRLALEALCHGRHVITGYELPNAHVARSIDEFASALRELREKPVYNLEGRSFVNREHEQNAAIKALRRELEDAVEPGRLNLALEGGLRGAAMTLHHLHLLSPRNFSLPEIDQLPSESHALRSLLQDLPQSEHALAALAP